MIDVYEKSMTIDSSILDKADESIGWVQYTKEYRDDTGMLKVLWYVANRNALTEEFKQRVQERLKNAGD